MDLVKRTVSRGTSNTLLTLSRYSLAPLSCSPRCQGLAIVSWSDGSDCSDYNVEYVTSASDDGTIQIPATSEDSDFEGPEMEFLVLCHGHGKASQRRAAFEGIHTGGRFLCCAEKSILQSIIQGKKCGLVEWIDPAWHNTLENALSKLWSMYEQSKIDMTKDKLMNLFAVHNLTQEKKKLQDNYEKLVEDVNGLLNALERRADVETKDLENNKLQEKYDMVKNLVAAQAGVIRNMKRKLAKERNNLQIHSDELQKTVEQSNVKL
ncbi:hypothetical protein D1007_49277 [Hordeum vulgare]|nr:hypothetical protein D1007_49277 [Hordeum vulgare]